MHSKNRFEPGLVRYIVEGAAQDSARSLELLRAIEVTVQVNQVLAESFEQISHRFGSAIESICGRPADKPESPIDPSGEIRASLENTMNVVATIADHLKTAKASAIADDELRDDDGVVESFSKVIAAIVEAHDTLNELNWAIMEHDADRSPLSEKGPFRTPNDLISAILN